MTEPTPHISVCICTYKRPNLLKRLLHELNHQETGGQFTYSIVVSDNDHLESARPIVAKFVQDSSVPMRYCVEPQQNIALTRNRAIENAKGDYVAFIDDDEFPVKDWLQKLFKACNNYGADGVLGPVKPFFDQEPPQWLIRGRFCERAEHPTGTVIEWPEARTGNVLLKSQILTDMREPFRRQFGSGSEDTDFFRRMVEGGRIFKWCNEAVVYEVVPPTRWKRSYLFKRALLRGQNQAHLAGFYSVTKSLIAVPLYAILLPFLLIFGQTLFVKYLIKLLDHAGKLLAVFGVKPMGDKYLAG